jgi:hypothetical protein
MNVKDILPEYNTLARIPNIIEYHLVSRCYFFERTDPFIIYGK